MAAKICYPPKEVKIPEIDWANFSREDYEAANNKYLNDLKEKLHEMGYKGQNVGETIQFPRADGYAVYMVARMKPLILVHVPLGDAWEEPNVDLITSVRVQEMIDQQKALKEFFSKNQKNS